MTNPVAQALERAKLAEREEFIRRNEAAMHAALLRQFGDPPLQQTPAMVAALSAFVHWSEAKGVRSFPAAPATVAQFTLENAGLGVDAVSEVLDHIAVMHEANGLANPVATWIVSEALDRVSSETEAPRSWPKEHKWRFTQLPCILRRYLVKHEHQRERTVRQSQNDAAAARQQLAAIQPTEANDVHETGNDPIAPHETGNTNVTAEEIHHTPAA
jgi:hypothetical protein